MERSDVAHVLVPIHDGNLDHGQAPVDGGALQVPVVHKDDGQAPENKGGGAQQIHCVQVLKARGDEEVPAPMMTQRKSIADEGTIHDVMDSCAAALTGFPGPDSQGGWGRVTRAKR